MGVEQISLQWSLDDLYWMGYALRLAEQAARMDEVPIGAVLVQGEQLLGQGWNAPIQLHDPSAHAEILALRAAGIKCQNYRLPNTTLYTTLEPCVMCAGALLHARIQRLVFAASDPKGGAGTVFALLPPDQRFNHRLIYRGGLLATESATLLRHFFQQRR